MKQQGKKKEWVAPELVVLVRSHPEEAVLTVCKGTGTSGPVQVGHCTPFGVNCDSTALS